MALREFSNRLDWRAVDLIDALDPAAASFANRLDALTPDALTNPTPCTEWDVRALVEHVIGGNHMSVALLDGATAEEPTQAFRAAGQEAGDALHGAFTRSVELQRAAFHRAGALDGTVHHVIA